MSLAEDLAAVMPKQDSDGTISVVTDEDAVPILRELALLKKDKIKNQAFDVTTKPVYLWDDPQRFLDHWRSENLDMAIVVRWDHQGAPVYLYVLHRLGKEEMQTRWFIGTVLVPEPKTLHRAMYDLGIRRVAGRVDRNDVSYLARLKANGRTIKVTGEGVCWSVTLLEARP